MVKKFVVLYLVDISSFIFRAYYAIQDLKTSRGEPVNAVYGVATMLFRFLKEAQPEYVAIVYDSKTPSFRKQIDPHYKANRLVVPEDLSSQFHRIEEMIQELQFSSYRQDGLEADDLIASLTQAWLKKSDDHQVVIVSSDKDLMQLVTTRVTLWDTLSHTHYGPQEVFKKFGVHPHQMRDYLALVGDRSDNILGVPGCGPKTACDWIREFETLEAILTAGVEGKISGKKGQGLVTYAAQARLAADLVTLRDSIELSCDHESLRYELNITEAGIKLLEDLEFHSLLKEFKQKSVENKSEAYFQSVLTEAALQDLLTQLEIRREFAFDLETTGLNPRSAEIVGLAICYESTGGYYIPLKHQEASPWPCEETLQRFKALLEDPQVRKIGQNLKFDLSICQSYGIQVRGVYADTMLASYVLHSEGRHDLQTLCKKYLNYSVITYEDVCCVDGKEINFSEVSIEKATRYSAEDAWTTFVLWKKLEIELEKQGLSDLFFKLDMPLVSILTQMELTGVCIDENWLIQLSAEFHEQLVQLEKQIQEETQQTINLNSPKQLAFLLFEHLKLPTQSKTKTGFSTDAAVLERLARLHPVPQLILEYREIAKLKNTYVDPIPLLKDGKTGKIHASFHQAVTVTGRLSSSNPNLQNIPIRTVRGMKIRRAFIPSPGNLLISADYSQIELRLLGHMSQDPELIRAFLNHEDVHCRTASEIFDISLDQVQKEQRSIAKAINFGLMYGKTAFGLSQELGITRQEAQTMMDRYFQRYAGVKSFFQSQIELARTHQFVTTLLGRKRYLTNIHSKNSLVRAHAERMAMNSPIQGTAADLMKLAMIQVQHQLELGGFAARLIIQVHDELVLDCPRAEIESVQLLLVKFLESTISLSVPLKVNCWIGAHWADRSFKSDVDKDVSIEVE